MKIKDYNYDITEEGIVTSLKTNKRIRPSNSWNGYLRVGLFKNGKRIYKQLHRLVAETFLPNPEGKPEVNHKDFDKKNCRLVNLEWVTKLENMQHAEVNGRVRRFKGEESGSAKLTDLQVAEIRTKRSLKRKDLAAEYKVSVRQILRVLNDKNYRETGKE